MTEETASAVARLDRSKPPPGYEVERWRWRWAGTSSAWILSPEPISATWSRHEARLDPPGMNWLGGFACSPRTNPKAAEARTAAWAWYWRRVALSIAVNTHTLDHIELQSIPDPWPRCLSWSDDQVAEVEQWLADSTAEMPEVLHG